MAIRAWNSHAFFFDFSTVTIEDQALVEFGDGNWQDFKSESEMLDPQEAEDAETLAKITKEKVQTVVIASPWIDDNAHTRTDVIDYVNMIAGKHEE